MAFLPIAFLMLWTILATLWVNTPINNSYLRFIIFPLGFCLAYRYLEIQRLRKSILVLINWLLIISILVHFLAFAGFFSIENITISEANRNVSLHFFVVPTYELDMDIFPIPRFCSIYWEPGQCQIVLMYILVLYTKDICQNICNFIYIFKKYGFIFISIVLTGSTTGYFVFMLYIVSVLLFNDKVKKNFVIGIFFTLVAVAIVLFVLSTNVIQDKIAQSESAERSSFTIRMADNLACFQIAAENPIFGLGVNSKRLDSELFGGGSETASNGWLFSAAQMGFVYIFFLILLMYHNIKRMDLKVNSLLILLVLIISQANEHGTFFPYMWIYCLPFGKDTV